MPRAANRWGGPPQPLLDTDHVARLLGSCDRRSSAGRRDHAMLTILARLGLRSAEVAALSVDDVHWRAGKIVVCVTVFSTSQGLTYPLLALLMERSGEAATAIAVNAAMTPLGIIASAPLINRHLHRFPISPTIAAAIGLSILLLVLVGLFRSAMAWLPLRFLLGCSTNVVYVLGEATLLAIAPPSHRGRMMGAYTSITNVGYAIGPLILVAVGSSGMTPFLVLSAILVLAAAPFFFIAVDRSRDRLRTAPA